MKVIVVSGGFDPLHSGHISYFKDAKERGDKLVVAINSDDWLIRKKGKCFMPLDERKAIIENLSFVDLAIDFEDDDHGRKHRKSITQPIGGCPISWAQCPIGTTG